MPAAFALKIQQEKREKREQEDFSVVISRVSRFSCLILGAFVARMI
jgi:hypothetical protein